MNEMNELTSEMSCMTNLTVAF